MQPMYLDWLREDGDRLKVIRMPSFRVFALQLLICSNYGRDTAGLPRGACLLPVCQPRLDALSPMQSSGFPNVDQVWDYITPDLPMRNHLEAGI